MVNLPVRIILTLFNPQLRQLLPLPALTRFVHVPLTFVESVMTLPPTFWPIKSPVQPVMRLAQLQIWPQVSWNEQSFGNHSKNTSNRIKNFNFFAQIFFHFSSLVVWHLLEPTRWSTSFFLMVQKLHFRMIFTNIFFFNFLWIKNCIHNIKIYIWTISDYRVGDCLTDQMSISAPGSTGSPVICGYNTGQHSN